MHITRKFTQDGQNPYKMFDYEFRDVIVKDKGVVIFSQKNVQVPSQWSQNASDILASKYFRRAGVDPIVFWQMLDNYAEINPKFSKLYKHMKKCLKETGLKIEFGGETSVIQVVHRIVGCYVDWGICYDYFYTVDDAIAYYDEMVYMMLNQMAAPNSPSWFNNGLFWAYRLTGDPAGHYYVEQSNGKLYESHGEYIRPTPHACYILRVEDTLLGDNGLMDHVKTEARIFKQGSGCGTNFSNIRAEGEPLSKGGTSSGVMSFLKIFDRAADAIKSGGVTRRAAKMVILDIDHPDIEEFIEWKEREEYKAQLLIQGGLPADFDGEAYHTVSGQNSNNSVMISDAFMKAYRNGETWKLIRRTDGKVAQEVDANYIMNKIAKAAWACADPGVQFVDTMNAWNTCLNDGMIRATNPCVTGDTLVATDHGLIRIDCLVGTQPMVYGADGKLHKATRVWMTGVKPVYLLKTKSGYTIKVTADHKIKTRRGDVEAKDLVRGDIISIFDLNAPDKTEDVFLSLSPCGEEAVFDLTEPDTHHFVANGIVVHNCSEYTWLDNTACNLASLNLLKFCGETGVYSFDLNAFRHAVHLWTLTLEISVAMAQLPTKEVAWGTYNYRTLGLGYTNLGALLMVSGMPYDSKEGRNVAGAITAIMTGEAYVCSSLMAKALGPFPRYEANKEHMLRVIRNHRRAVTGPSKNDEFERLNVEPLWLDCRVLRGSLQYLLLAAKAAWDRALEYGQKWGYRNAQVTVLAPTGTIGLLMDCDTLGIEPDFALVKHKKLAGGGFMKIVNRSIDRALKNLGYSEEERSKIHEYIMEYNKIEGAPFVREAHYPVFDTANKNGDGKRFIRYMAHVEMMGYVQPFLSGSISKTINVPNEATVEDVLRVYLEAHSYGLKAVALYRDGCKASQPLSSQKKEAEKNGFKTAESKIGVILDENPDVMPTCKTGSCSI